MGGIIQRMNRLKALLNVRVGPGAAVLPPEITRIHMDFAAKWNDGHMGPRVFWRQYLPRLKYWNPAVPMIVNRSQEQAGSATLTVYFRQSAGAVPAPDATPAHFTSTVSDSSVAHEPTQDERVVTINMKHQRSETILAAFLDKTGAVPVTPDPSEEAEMRELEHRTAIAEVDRERTRKLVTEARREAAMLAQARSDAVGAKAS